MTEQPGAAIANYGRAAAANPSARRSPPILLLCLVLGLGAAVTRPLPADAAPEGAARIGILWPLGVGDPAARAPRTELRHALAKVGYVEGQNIVLEHRYAASRAGK